MITEKAKQAAIEYQKRQTELYEEAYFMLHQKICPHCGFTITFSTWGNVMTCNNMKCGLRRRFERDNYE